MIDVILWCLALNVYFEARSEPIHGQYGVAEVTITRASVSGRNLCEEVYLDKQFSWMNGKGRPVVTNLKAWELASLVAAASLAKPTSFTKGATHYHAIMWKGKPFPKPKWAYDLCETVRIGNHIFYKPCEVK